MLCKFNFEISTTLSDTLNSSAHNLEILLLYQLIVSLVRYYNVENALNVEILSM